MSKKNKKVKKVVKKVVKSVAKKCCCTATQSLKIIKPFNKSQIATAIADATCLSKKNVSNMLDALYGVVVAHLKKRGGPGEFTLPNVAKFRIINKPATKAREGVNPFTGETMMFAAKPARNVVKVRPLKKIKDAAK